MRPYDVKTENRPVVDAERPAAPMVKQLEWGETSYGNPEAHCIAGAYRLNRSGDGGWSVSIKSEVLRHSDGRSSFATLEAAKAAAQSDYENRILSALISSPGKDGGREVEEPCPTCGNEERGQGGYLSCECPAPRPASTALVERLEAYDAGLLNDFGGGDVSWWQDYIRAELDRAHEFYAAQLSAGERK